MNPPTPSSLTDTPGAVGAAGTSDAPGTVAPCGVAAADSAAATPDGAAPDDLRWTAVRDRDTAFDGEFVYAVRTTGVYCRPSCPSRPALRTNVRFFDTTHQAAAAGFRPCRRCRPDDAPLARRRGELVARACAALEASPTGVALEALAREAGMTSRHFHRVFKSVVGVTPKAYQLALRARRSESALRRAPSVTDAIFDAGFNSTSRFYGSSDATLGMTPSAYRAGGTGIAIRYALEPCALGVILIAATPRGVCAIEFGDSAHDLVGRLATRFPQALLETADPAFRGWVARVLAAVERPRDALELPLDVQGTAFQRQVWQALRAIPPGRTASYGEVAQAIGRPEAARAVATACAGNPVALAIPCHRVVRSDGTLSGYRWGTARKAELLRREQTWGGTGGTGGDEPVTGTA